MGSVLLIYYPTIAARLSELYTAVGLNFDEAMPKLHAIILARMIAALGAGAITAAILALVNDIFDEDTRALPIGIVAGVDTLGWLVGAAWGALVVQYYDWPTIFIINIPLIVFSMALMWFWLANIDTPRTDEPFDWRGLVLLVCTLTLLNIGLSGVQLQWHCLRLLPWPFHLD